MANITGAQVRNRLRTLTSVEVSDTLLSDALYLDASDSWMNLILANNGAGSYSDLSDDKKAMCKVAQCAWVCLRIITSAPVDNVNAGPIKIAETNKAEIIKAFTNEIEETLGMLGYTINGAFVMSYGSDDYAPNGTDSRNISFTDQENGDFSVWP